jgi:hypothetical protein
MFMQNALALATSNIIQLLLKNKMNGLVELHQSRFPTRQLSRGLKWDSWNTLEGPRDTSKGITSTHHTFGKWHNHSQKL